MEVEILQYETYLETIKKSVGSELFQTVWAEVDGEKKDIANRGQYSCAIHVSRILLWFGLVQEIHAMTPGLVKDMNRFGWKKIQKPRLGCVLHWGKTYSNGSENEHVGFYMGDEKAISNNRDSGVPVEHYYSPEKLEAMYWHPKLDEWEIKD